MYMQDYGELTDREGFEIPPIPLVHAIAALTYTKHYKRRITAQMFVQEQAKDSYCHQAWPTFGLPGWTFNYNRNGFLIYTAPMDRWVQKAVPTSLKSRLSYHSHYPTLDGHPGERRMYESTRGEYYRLHMVNDIYMTVRDCCEWPRNKPLDKCWRPLQLFLASFALKFVALDRLGALSMTFLRPPICPGNE